MLTLERLVCSSTGDEQRSGQAVPRRRLPRGAQWALPGELYMAATSTQSAPTILKPLSARRHDIASPDVTPPISGVPVPGANAGSTKSTSNETNAGWSRTRSFTTCANSSGEELEAHRK